MNNLPGAAAPLFVYIYDAEDIIDIKYLTYRKPYIKIYEIMIKKIKIRTGLYTKFLKIIYVYQPAAIIMGINKYSMKRK